MYQTNGNSANNTKNISIMKTKVIIRLMGKSWLVTNYETNKAIATVSQGWHFVTLTRLKGWDIVNKTALSPEISSKIS